ncbi:hypothetical protein PUNSTDRAFT_138128 [Punctularia strigosozonata HHB-11173 SS5]|uniref:IMD domain-containing protein n=1 Tax=Punctularia strigosozonata (strain HHB-11173) TaxID=741275 RepID=R7S5R8_PUNST|nr:uncharacterized protein PUNSTDRAFT_138128 [Punctularia strigosozonata HHB-11173 SS5]EIN04941.1 hypothetical protein PUNSTDRAFT_138128 [Punctularia strigosozonata HHB-11173 SS5]
MAAATAAPAALAERVDIHKSCKTLENVVNLLNDYCEAASAIVQLQKRLAKAIKEAASANFFNAKKVNAFSASAVIFDVVSDVDGKFAKLADKECDWISTEVKKWFKKLAKEEKLHDDRISNANNKIKSAGQAYERKAKKNARDVAEEHTKYLSLLSTLGPEMTQEKYNHAAFVTQRHTMTTFSVAACLAKVADAEWVRACESVRRCAPTVGVLGEWRALCEGGWTGPIPQALPEDDGPTTTPQPGMAPINEDQARELQVKLAPQGRDAGANGNEREPPQYVPNDPERGNDLHARNMPSATSSSDLSNHNSNARMPRAQLSQDRYNSATSLASLASFPSPPTHVPPPLVASPLASRTVSLEAGDSADSSQKAVSFPSSVRNMASPESEPQEPKPKKSGETLQDADTDASNTQSPPTAQYQSQEDGNVLRSSSAGQLPVIDTRPSASGARPLEQSGRSVEAARKDNQISQPIPSDQNDMGTGSAANRMRDSVSYPKGDYTDDREFGVRRDAGSPVERRDAGAQGKALERSESVVSAGSVAALRNRYSYTTTPASPPPRDVPKLNQSVSSLATRYAPRNDDPPSPIQRTTSPRAGSPRARPLGTEPTSVTRSGPSGNRASMTSEDITRRHRRLEELEELQLRERELELREREREIESKARELERDRVRLDTMRTQSVYYTDSSSRTMSLQHLPPALPPPRTPPEATRLVPPNDSRSPPRGQLSSSTSSQHTPQPSGQARPADHAPYCGCNACSVEKYRQRDPSPSPRDLRPPEPPIQLRPEKPKGWIRRLSMPVVTFGASSSDNRTRKLSNSSMSNGISNLTVGGSRTSLAIVEEDGRLTNAAWEQKNRSAVNLVGRR